MIFVSQLMLVLSALNNAYTSPQCPKTASNNNFTLVYRLKIVYKAT